MTNTCVMTNICHNKTKILCLSRQKLSRQAYFCYNNFCHNKNDTCGSSCRWYFSANYVNFAWFWLFWNPGPKQAFYPRPGAWFNKILMQDSTKMLTCKRWSWRQWGPSHQEPERTCGRSHSAGPPCPGGRLRGTAAALAEGLVQWCPLVPILVWNKQSVAQQQAMTNVVQDRLTGQWQLTVTDQQQAMANVVQDSLTDQQQAMANVVQDSLTGQWQLTQQQAMKNVAQDSLTGQWQLTLTAQQQAMKNVAQDSLTGQWQLTLTDHQQAMTNVVQVSDT